MTKNNRVRRKAQVKQRNKAKARAWAMAKTPRKPKDLDVSSFPAFQYYQFVFDELREEADPLIKDATRSVRDARCRFWISARIPGIRSGEPAWNELNTYLHQVEIQIREIVERHTHYFWVYLYRRIGTGLHPDLNNVRDARTIALVRHIMEAAFVRYSILSPERADIRPVTELTIKDVAGGILLKFFERVADAKGTNGSRVRDVLINSFMESRQWVLVDFSVGDYVDVFRLEALAYEYWLTTARMRRVGKGGAFTVSALGEPDSVDDSMHDALFKSFDMRSEPAEFVSSAIAVAFYPDGVDKDLRGLGAVYNTNRLAWKEICLFEESELHDFVTNFYFGIIELGAYARAHSPMDAAFKAARGFSLRGLCVTIAAVTMLEFITAQSNAEGKPRQLALLNLYQRGYIINVRDGYRNDLRKVAEALMQKWLGHQGEDFADEFDKVCEYLTLYSAKQQGVGLWSLGPRYAFIEYECSVVVDLQGLQVILRNAFFGVRIIAGDKGVLFEDAFREYAASRGLDVLPERSLRLNSDEHREVDAAIRVGSTLYLCECRAMEKPLDLEISRPRTVASRIDDFGSKVEQSLSLAEFVRDSPCGKNYDYTWAERIVALVVSPFVEWIWSFDPKLWVDSDTPRILSSEEAVTFIERAG